jgi:hypothetical protein
MPKPARRHHVVVDHAQRAKAHVSRVEVLGKREAVKGLQPAMVGKAAFVGSAQGQHVKLLLREVRVVITSCDHGFTVGTGATSVAEPR